MNRWDLTGEVAVVTGSRGRLGGIWTQALREAGALVIESDTPLVAIDEIRSNCDITKRDEVEQALACWTAMYGLPTILVNNAGVDDRPTPTTMAGARPVLAKAMADCNLLGTYNMLTIVGGAMAAAGRGSIINIASLYGLISPDMRYYGDSGFEKHAMYGATKAGVISLTHYFAAYYGPKGVRVNALAPGGVVNPGDPLTGQDDGFKARYTARIPMGRMCTPEDLGGPLVFLASKASSFVNGVVLPVDGGFLCW